jgi:methylmalonyl-CoA mutase N-terminal domain/subunit
MDEALALPTEEAVRIALRTQQIVAYESGVGNTIDPLGGSYAVESLTNSLEAEADALVGRIDEMGGMVRAIESGFVQREIQESAYRMQREIESGERAIVGVNRFQEEEGAKIPILRVDPKLEREQVERLRAFRAARSGDALRHALNAVKSAAASGENLMPPIIDAVDCGVTLGEISDILRQVFGEYRESVTV